MRVVVASDTIGSLSSAQAGAVIATGWPGADVTVVIAGESGRGFAAATADGWGVELVSGVLDGRLVSWAHSEDAVVVSVVDQGRSPAPGIPGRASSYDLGRALKHALWERQTPVVTVLLDCAGIDTHDGGAGLLAALGAMADVPLDRGVDALASLSELDLGPARQLLAGARLVGVVPADQIDRALLGLRGITSVRGRIEGADTAELLATDAALEKLAHLAETPPGAAEPTGPRLGARAGAGACGGIGLAVLALGGTLRTGPSLALGRQDVVTRIRGADLLVTGCSVFDFATRGGGVVAVAAEAAAAGLIPCVAVAGAVLIGAREMRTLGVESAYAIRESAIDDPTGGDVTEAELTALMARVGRSWRW